MDNIPPMADPSMTGNPQDDGAFPTDNQMDNGNPGIMGGQDDMGSDDSNEFDSDFNPDVEADENSDPKKFIQQLTGKLSQSLRKYNSNQPQPDSELCKYVAGMILKQTTENLNGDDKQDILDKVNDGGDDNDDDSDNSYMGDDKEEPQMNDDGMDNEQPMTERVDHMRLVNEIFQELTQKRDDGGQGIAQGGIKDVGFRKKPFTAPR